MARGVEERPSPEQKPPTSFRCVGGFSLRTHQYRGQACWAIFDGAEVVCMFPATARGASRASSLLRDLSRLAVMP